jgi:GNAT superfamily N-acetyltransferase
MENRPAAPAIVRPARPEELPALVELMRAYHEHDRLSFHPERAGRSLGELMADPRLGAVWTIASGSQAIGYLALTFGYSLECGGRDAFVDELFLLPAFRGQGAGTRALQRAIGWCTELGVRAIRLEVTRRNREALALYRRLGFEDHDRYLMTLALDLTS